MVPEPHHYPHCMSHLPGIAAKTVQTSRLRSNVLYRTDGPAGTVPLVFVHGNVSSSLFWEPLMLALPREINAVAVDLRGYGDSEVAPVDGTRGIRDFSDDLAEVLADLDLEPAHLVGWSMGAGVVLQYLLDAPERVASVALVQACQDARRALARRQRGSANRRKAARRVAVLPVELVSDRDVSRQSATKQEPASRGSHE